MPLNIPLPSADFGANVAKIPGDVQSILSKILEGKQNQQRVNILGQAEQRAQQEQPLKMDALKAKLEEQNIINKNKEAYIKSQIKSNESMADWRQQGGGKGGVFVALERNLHNNIGMDNPQLNNDPAKLREAADVYANNGDTLSDGTKLNPPSQDTIDSFNAKSLKTTTGALATQGVNANQAEAEMDTIDKYINEGRKPYGDTVLGYSGAQIQDSLNVKDNAAQERVGKFIASELLKLDKAAILTRVSGLEKGIQTIDQIKNGLSPIIKAKFPMLSEKARQVALDQIGKAMKDILAKRNEYGIGAGGASGKRFGGAFKNKSSGSVKKWVVQNGKLVEA